MTIFLPAVPAVYVKDLALFLQDGYFTQYDPQFPARRTSSRTDQPIVVQSHTNDLILGDATAVVLDNLTGVERMSAEVYTTDIHQLHLCNRLYTTSNRLQPLLSPHIRIHHHTQSPPQIYYAGKQGYHVISSDVPIAYGAQGVVLHPDPNEFFPLTFTSDPDFRDALKFPQITLWNIRVCRAWANNTILPVPPFM